jgi:hypothetical protein
MHRPKGGKVPRSPREFSAIVATRDGLPGSGRQKTELAGNRISVFRRYTGSDYIDTGE